MRLLITPPGRTPFNVAKKFLGQVNEPLDDMGQWQAEALAGRLEYETITAIVSSPLERALATANAIASRHNLFVLQDSDLLEVSMGAWEGRVQADVKREEAALFACWLEDPARYYPAGGESLMALRDRAALALARWQAAYPTPEGHVEPVVVWVTHPALIGVLMCHLLDLPLQQRRHFHTDYASLSKIHLVQAKRGVVPVLRSFNEVEHMRQRGLWNPPDGYDYID